jgi:glycosyltransferase involved in cell wall biosynthesis
VKITYTSTNISHHYRYARELHRLGSLHAFVTAASRFSPRAAIDEMGDKLVRSDFWQNLYLAALRGRAPDAISGKLAMLSANSVDRAACHAASKSDVFLHYRTTGRSTTRWLRSAGCATLCVMEEVNSHVESCQSLLKDEFEKLGRGTYQSSFPDHGRRVEAYEEADCILCPSSFVKRTFLERGFQEERLLMVNFGFTFPQKTECEPRTNGVFRLLYVGQLHFRKGLRYAIEAFRVLKHPKKEFVLVGPATKVTGLEGVSLPAGVRFTGILKGAALDAAYASASAFVLPTIEEGLALVQGEAMAAGLPLITTTHSGGDDLITHGKEGFILPPCDSAALTQAFQMLADSTELRESMSQAARARANELGGWDVAAKNLVTALQKARDRWMNLRPR